MKYLVQRDPSICPACLEYQALQRYRNGQLVKNNEWCDSLKCKFCNTEFAIITFDKDMNPIPVTDFKEVLEFANGFISNNE